MLKNIAATFAGLIVAVLMVYIFETYIGHTFFPLPEFSNPGDLHWLKANMDIIPLGSKICVVLGHLVGIIAGMFVAGIISKTSMVPAYIVATLMLLATTFVTFALPKDTIFIVAEIGSMIVGFFFGKRLAQKHIY